MISPASIHLLLWTCALQKKSSGGKHPSCWRSSLFRYQIVIRRWCAALALRHDTVCTTYTVCCVSLYHLYYERINLEQIFTLAKTLTSEDMRFLLITTFSFHNYRAGLLVSLCFLCVLHFINGQYYLQILVHVHIGRSPWCFLFIESALRIWGAFFVFKPG